MDRGTFYIVSGPSGAGKGTLVSFVMANLENVGLSVSATTRSPRFSETDGVSYHFLSDEQFDDLVERGCFVEWANVHGKRYGTLRSEVDRNLAEGRDIILEIDVQGAMQVREAYPEAVLIFIEPPSMAELVHRLLVRGTDSEESIRSRLATANEELNSKDSYDIVITNDDLETAQKQILDEMRKRRVV